MNRIYLDYNASTPVDLHVLNVFIQELKEEMGNPSSLHFHGQQCCKKLEEARLWIARFFKVKPQEIIFTSGGTEGAALLLQGVMAQKEAGHIVSSAAEHACVYHNLQQMKKKGHTVTFLSAREQGAVDPLEVEKAIGPKTCLLTFMAVNNETGVITDLEAIASVAKAKGIPLIVDGVAWLGKEYIQIPEGVSAIFFSGHKIHAPKGIGFCICRQNLKLSPLFVGGNQEFGRRAGTENLPGIVALAEAVKRVSQDTDKTIAHMRHLRDLLENELISRLPAVIVNGRGPRVCNTTNLAFLGVDGETLLINLDMAGLSVSHGSACSSGALEPSRILLEGMGIPLSQARSSIRFSIGRTTTEEEIHLAIRIIVAQVERLRSFQSSYKDYS